MCIKRVNVKFVIIAKEGFFYYIIHSHIGMCMLCAKLNAPRDLENLINARRYVYYAKNFLQSCMLHLLPFLAAHTRVCRYFHVVYILMKEKKKKKKKKLPVRYVKLNV